MADLTPRPSMIPPVEGDDDIVKVGAEARVAYLPPVPARRRHHRRLRFRAPGRPILESFAHRAAPSAH